MRKNFKTSVIVKRFAHCGGACEACGVVLKKGAYHADHDNPDGLTGEESPIASRIIQISDCIDAMLMERTYKKGYPVEKMLGELARCAGTEFDPKIAVAAIRWCRENPDKLILSGAPARAYLMSTTRPG